MKKILSRLALASVCLSFFAATAALASPPGYLSLDQFLNARGLSRAQVDLTRGCQTGQDVWDVRRESPDRGKTVCEVWTKPQQVFYKQGTPAMHTDVTHSQTVTTPKIIENTGQFMVIDDEKKASESILRYVEN